MNTNYLYLCPPLRISDQNCSSENQDLMKMTTGNNEVWAQDPKIGTRACYIS